MRRVGKYTKNSKIRSAKLTANKYVLWFKNLKAWQKVAVIIGPIAIIMVIVPLITYVYFARDIANKERLPLLQLPAKPTSKRTLSISLLHL